MANESGEPSRPRNVLLVQEEWPARAMLKAELEARGCSVRAVRRLRAGIQWVSARRFAPSVIVIDANGLDADTADLEPLLSLRSAASIILLSSTQIPAPEILLRSATRTLIRPFTIGEVADAVVQS